ncbi:MarR family transcriptional regulator [Nocardia otitidiscaviarum]|uniref:MarR family winged helix-turn-helix transcriptional regulator n=1 Tax=Nocardia otitidiscaviarum TaxID=1823 RepID=UPI001C8F8AFC|nr:MarR family transcriptional regulator [Nocardia otitidiscaviarum]MCP9619090.1 MarR family transcriptional regulator [Nocardia otitidiscaviarum]
MNRRAVHPAAPPAARRPSRRRDYDERRFRRLTEEAALSERSSADVVATDLSEAADLYLTIGRLLRMLRQSGDSGALSPGAASALASLARSGPLRLGDLAAVERVSAPTMSRIVTGLERAGYLERAADPGDGRAQLLTATPTGHNLVNGLTSARIQRFAAAMERLDREQKDALTTALNVLVDELAR